MSVDKSIKALSLRGQRLEIEGRTTTRPMLLVSDGSSLTYGVNVNIGAVAGTDETELIAVPIARANREIFYGAEVGSPCWLRRTASGQWEVVGFSRTMPGTLKIVPVTVPPFQLGPASATTVGAVVDRTLIVRPLTLGDLGDLGGFGIVPLGALAAFRGGTFMEFR